MFSVPRVRSIAPLWAYSHFPDSLGEFARSLEGFDIPGSKA